MNNATGRVKVIGGNSISEEVGEGKDKKVRRTFLEKRSVVVNERDLGALFRRDWELCGMHIRIQNTNERVTPGYEFFSELRQK